VKLLLWVAVGLAVVAWLMRSKKTLNPPESSRQHAGGDAAKFSAGEGEPMVPCAHCGVHIPVSESVVGPEGSAYCSEEHRRLHS
jgi:uncharacterized protein